MITVTVYTGHGPIKVTKQLLDIWDMYGWPEDDVLFALEYHKDNK